MTTKANNFKRDLEFSKSCEALPMWKKVYQNFFPDFQSMETIDGPGWAQDAGIDRVIMLKSSKNIFIDEKVRRKSYPDIALEYYSCFERKTPGWIEKDLATDYIAYAFLPSRTVYLLPFQSLRNAWVKNGYDWIRYGEQKKNGFFIAISKTKVGKNGEYHTYSVAVPLKIIFPAIKNSLITSW